MVPKIGDREKQTILSAFGFTKKDSPEKSIELIARKKDDLRIETSDRKLGATPVERGNAAVKRILGELFSLLQLKK